MDIDHIDIQFKLYVTTVYKTIVTY